MHVLLSNSQHQRNLITKLNANSITSDFQNALDPISWEPTTVNGLQATLSEALMYKFCFNGTTGNVSLASVCVVLWWWWGGRRRILL